MHGRCWRKTTNVLGVFHNRKRVRPKRLRATSRGGPGHARLQLPGRRRHAKHCRLMGRQWLHAKRAIVNLKKGQAVGKLVKEITVAAKLGGADPSSNARLFAVLEKAKKASVTRDAIERAIKKGAGGGDDKSTLEHVVFEGYAPHKVPVIVEVYTDNHQRTAPEMRLLFRTGVLGTGGSNKFLFDHVGIVEAHHPDTQTDLEAAAIEAGANDFEAITHNQNAEIGRA